MDTSKLLRKGETVKDVSGAEITVLDTALDFNQRSYRVRMKSGDKNSVEWISQAEMRYLTSIN